MFKQRKNKRFSYKSRLKDESEVTSSDIEASWKSLKREKPRGSGLKILPVLIILFVMVLILMYILEGYIN